MKASVSLLLAALSFVSFSVFAQGTAAPAPAAPAAAPAPQTPGQIALGCIADVLSKDANTQAFILDGAKADVAKAIKIPAYVGTADATAAIVLFVNTMSSCMETSFPIADLKASIASLGPNVPLPQNLSDLQDFYNALGSYYQGLNEYVLPTVSDMLGADARLQADLAAGTVKSVDDANIAGYVKVVNNDFYVAQYIPKHVNFVLETLFGLDQAGWAALTTWDAYVKTAYGQ